jgi:UDP-glucose 4-epimerase
MTTVAITGVSGHLGRTLVRVLEDDPSVTRIVGVDRVEPRFTGRNLEFYSMDVRSPDLAGAIVGCDAVVHLAAVHNDPDEIKDNNVGGTRSVVDAASRVGVTAFVFASSHSVYGAHADNDFPLTEGSPVRPDPQNVFALSKAEAESIVSYFADEHPDVAVATLRFAWIGGPNVPRGSAPFLDAKVRFVVEGYDPPFQAVHEEDAAAAVAIVLQQGLRGVYNVCADDTVEAPEHVLGQRRAPLDIARARRVLDRTSRMGMSPPASQISALMYPRVMSNRTLRDAGFAPRHSSEKALRDAAAARREYVAVGPFNMKRRSAALVGGTIGLLAIAALRGRRSRRGTNSSR